LVHKPTKTNTNVGLGVTSKYHVRAEKAKERTGNQGKIKKRVSTQNPEKKKRKENKIRKWEVSGSLRGIASEELGSEIRHTNKKIWLTKG